MSYFNYIMQNELELFMRKESLELEHLWFAARTIACAELNMRDYLQKRNIECFVPTVIRCIQSKETLVKKEVPLISNIIFFKTDYTTANTLFSLNRRKIFCIRNKKGLITIPEKEMNEFIAFTNHYANKIEITRNDYLIGDRVKIKSGPFSGVEGVVVQINRKSYFTLSLGELLNVTVRFPKSNLIKSANEK